MAQTVEQLNERFGKGGVARFEKGNGGLVRAVLRGEKAEGQVYLHGAHVSHWQPAGQRPVLFMSGRSSFAEDKPIRGGVPICWPWFGNAGTPMHGFARLSEWTAEDVRQESDGAAAMTLSLKSGEWSRALWPEEFAVWFTVRFGAALEMELKVHNPSGRAWEFEEALHTYFAVSDIRQVALHGLENATFLNRWSDFKPVAGKPGAIRFEGEFDNNYPNNRATCVIEDPEWGRRITIKKTNSETTVVWNPWIDKAKAMPDFGDDEWPGMLCVETANARPCRVKLEAGATHVMGARITVG